MTDKTAHGPVANMVLQRVIDKGVVEIPTMTLSFSEIPTKGLADTSEKALAEEMATTIGIGSWNSKVTKRYHLFEKHWPEQNRYLRLVMRTEKDRILISLANIRVAFAYPALVEAELLQRQWMNQEVAKKTSLFEFWSEQVLPKAEAQSSLLNTGTGAIKDYFSNGSVIKDIGADTLKSIQNNLNNASNAVVDLTNEARNTVTQAKDTINQTGGAIKTTADSVTNAAGKAGNASDKVGSASDKVGALADDGRALIGKATLGNAMKVAFGVGAAGALGAALGNFLVDGTVAGIKKLYYAITQKADPEMQRQIEMLNRESVRALEENERDLVDLEKKIDVHLTAMEYAQGRSGTALLNELDTEMTLAEVQLKRLENHMLTLPNATASDREALARCAREMVEQKNLIENLKIAKSAMGQDPAIACQSLRMSLNKFVSIQNSITLAKGNLQNHMLMLMSSSIQRTKSAIQPLVSDNVQENELENSIEDLESSLRKIDPNSQSAALIRNNIDSMKARKARMVSYRNAIDKGKAAHEIVSSADRDMQSAEELYKSLSQGDCREGVSVPGLCDGRMGFMDAMKDYYSKKVQKAAQLCPSNNQYPPSPQSAQHVVASSAPVQTPVQAVPATAMAPSVPETPSSSGSWWSGIKDFFARLFGSQSRNISDPYGSR